jgi:hypothetical protein
VGRLPAWVEVNDRQSNFDEAPASSSSPADGVINGVKVGRYLQVLLEARPWPRFGFAYDINGSGRTIVRGRVRDLLETSHPAARRVRKRRTRRSSRRPALNANPSAYGANLLLKDGLPDPPGTDPARPAAGSTRSIFDINFRDAYARQWNFNVQRSLATNYMLEVAYVGSQGRQMLLKGDPNQAPPVLGVTDSNVNRPFIKLAPALRTIGQVQSKGTLDYNALLLKFQRRFANNFSFLNSYTFGKAIDLNSDNDGTVTLTNVYDPQYNRGPADYDITHTLSSSWIYEIPWAREKLWGGWQFGGILLLRGGLPLTVTQTQGVQSTGTGNRPNRVCDGKLANPTIDRWFDLDCFKATTESTSHLRRCGSQHHSRTRVVQHRCVADQEHEDRTLRDGVPGRGVQHPQTIRSSRTRTRRSATLLPGVISAMLSNPSCSVCGTVERQVQLGVKVRF